MATNSSHIDSHSEESLVRPSASPPGSSEKSIFASNISSCSEY